MCPVQIREIIDRTTTNSSRFKENINVGTKNFSYALQKAQATTKNPLDPLFQAAGQKFGLPPALLKAVAQVESGLNPRAVSSAGAQGLMQLMPATASSLGVRNALDPAENIYAGARYLRSLLDRFHGDIRLALAAYNAGPGAVAKYGGVPPFKETQNYLQRVLATLKETAPLNRSLQESAYRQDTPVSVAKQLTMEGSTPEWLQVWLALLLARAALTFNTSFDNSFERFI